MRKELQSIIIIAIIVTVSTCSAFDISSQNLQPGDKITLTGKAAPGEQVNLRSSFAMDLPVKNGKYEYETNVEIPQKPNNLAVTARNIKDLNLGVKMVIWVTKSFPASGGVASISHSDVPPGRYDLKMFGSAVDKASKVTVEVDAETAVKADPAGRYSLVIDTSGIPNGDYRISGAGDSKVVHIGGHAEDSSSGSSSSSGSAGSWTPPAKESSPDSPGIEITQDVIQWYAGLHGLDPKNSGQYAEAERQLKNMLSGGYWKVIAQGEPLTEKAGNCEDKYCLVRGIGACTTCRDEEMLLKPNKKPERTDAGVTPETASAASKNAAESENPSPGQGQPSSSPGEPKGLLDSIIDGFKSVIGG